MTFSFCVPPINFLLVLVYRPEDFRQCEPLKPPLLVYKAVYRGDWVVVKFAQRYGTEVHSAWAEHDCAPGVIEHRDLPGGKHGTDSISLPEHANLGPGIYTCK